MSNRKPADLVIIRTMLRDTIDAFDRYAPCRHRTDAEIIARRALFVAHSALRSLESDDLDPDDFVKIAADYLAGAADRPENQPKPNVPPV
jgi:hypothetical protein